MNAHDLFDTAPLGSLVSFANDQPRPPERFRRKLAAWRTWNGTGRLVAIYPRRLFGSSFQSAGFVLKIGEYGLIGHRQVSKELRLGERGCLIWVKLTAEHRSHRVDQPGPLRIERVVGLAACHDVRAHLA